MRRSKIVCTIGPASESPEMLKHLIEAGMNVARLNFSHGELADHGRRIANIRRACAETGKIVAILLDTKGPEIRTGVLQAESVELIAGERVALTTEEIVGDARRFSISYGNLPKEVKAGSNILIDDGLIMLEVIEAGGAEIECRVVIGGPLKHRKGVNVPGVKVNLPGMTDKDARDIVFGIEQGIDFIAASFVRKAQDVLEIRELLESHGAASQIQIIAKIENHEGVQNMDEILEVSDGIMVARGDLGVDLPTEEVPLVQKRIIQKCNVAGKPVITATQMLDSMQRNPRPTRAEANDVANAIFDGTDAIMLSGETAAGKYPAEAVRMMAKIAERTEEAMEYRDFFLRQSAVQQISVTEAISQAVANSAHDLQAKAIITATQSGFTARMVSKYRPKTPIIAVTPFEYVTRRMCLIWGVIPFKGESAENTDEMLQLAVESGIETGLVQLGDLVVITAGVPVGQTGTTNLIKVHQIGEMIAKGQGIGTHGVSGIVVAARSAEEANAKMLDGAVLVTAFTDKEYIPAFQRAAAVITETGGITSHAAVVGVSLGIPVIVGVERALELLKDGMYISVYPEVGIIYSGQAKIL